MYLLISADWMLTVPFLEMTDEQKTFFVDFEKKEKHFLQERDNRRKLLETECKKLKNDVADICRQFDERVQLLLEERIEVQKRIFVQVFSVPR